MSERTINRLGRVAISVALLIYFAACSAGVFWLAKEGEPWAATPLAFLAFGLLRETRLIMFWLSTPTERAVLAQHIAREPLIKALANLLRRPE